MARQESEARLLSVGVVNRCRRRYWAKTTLYFLSGIRARRAGPATSSCCHTVKTQKDSCFFLFKLSLTADRCEPIAPPSAASKLNLCRLAASTQDSDRGSGCSDVVRKVILRLWINFA